MTDLLAGIIVSNVTTLVGIALTALVNNRLKKIHTEVNGKMTKLVAVTAESSKAEGILEGREARKEEQKPVNAANITAAKNAGIIEGRAQYKKEIEDCHE